MTNHYWDRVTAPHADRPEVPAGLPLHESAHRDGDNVPSDGACTCPWVDPSLWTTYGSAVEPGSQREFDPECPEHGMASGRDHAEAMCRVAHHAGWTPPVAIPGNRDPRYRVAACFQCQKAARACVEVEERHTAELRAENERLRDGWRSVTSALGYGDGITEPQIGFADFIRECERNFSEADEWRESQRWRDECAMAGHADTEDCFEHDPTLRLEALADEREAWASEERSLSATIARVEALPGAWESLAEEHDRRGRNAFEMGDVSTSIANAAMVSPYRGAARDLRAALRGPEPTEDGA